MANKPGRPRKQIGTGGNAGHTGTVNAPGVATNPGLQQITLAGNIGECMGRYWVQFGRLQGNPQAIEQMLTEVRADIETVNGCIKGFETLEQQLVTLARSAQTGQGQVASITA